MVTVVFPKIVPKMPKPEPDPGPMIEKPLRLMVTLEAATERAFALGALEVEGYPAVPYSAPDLMPAAFAWTGVPKLFERAGYESLPRPGISRPLFLKARTE